MGHRELGFEPVATLRDGEGDRSGELQRLRVAGTGGTLSLVQRINGWEGGWMGGRVNGWMGMWISGWMV